ncbi:MAG: DUF951 domain-containing protein [Clostridiales Family XIII bacterium]|jgi:hypothetical protein|nr:DUF951 domain-containing protein [Clostridiales Family XIII bacterium]
MMEFQIGDRVELKKPHPCGGKTFEVMRIGMDCRLKCETCGASVWLSRRDFEKRIKKRLEIAPAQ